jgi:hypothetical protein
MSEALLERIAAAEEALERSGGLKFDKYAMGPWSVSKLKMATACQFHFYLNYLLKVKQDSDYVQNTDLADAGTISHKILEYIVLGHDVPESFALAKADHCNLKPGFKPGTANVSEAFWEENVLNVEQSVIMFKERLEKFERNNKVLKKLTELRLGITKDYKPCGFFDKNVYFRGIVDLVLMVDTGEGYLPDLIAWDHKNGGGEYGNSTKNYDLQLNTYKVLLHYGYQKCSGAVGGINFVRAQKMILGEYTDASEIEDKLVQRMEFYLSSVIDTMKENGYFKHVAGSACTYCEFKTECKSGELKPVELRSKKWFPIKEVPAEEVKPKKTRKTKVKDE